MAPRQVIKKINPNVKNIGDSAAIRQFITKNEHELLDPFVSFVEFFVSPPGGFKDNPSRGFESVTYIFKGGIMYEDCFGHNATIHQGDVQWITVGRGNITSEVPEEEVNKGLQLWINLPSTHKMIEPKTLELSSSEIPTAEKDGVKVKVIAGESMGIKSPVYTKTPIILLDFTLEPKAQTHQTVPDSWTALAYVIKGDEGVFSTSDSSTAQAKSVVVFGTGDEVSVRNTSSSRPLRFLLIAGEPIREPVVKDGPYVMNSQAEIDMTNEDYNHDRNGFDMANCWAAE